MYCAWLESSDGYWYRRDDYQDVLDHNGRFVICDDEIDYKAIEDTIAVETGKPHVFKNGSHCVYVSEYRIFESYNDDTYEYLASGNTCMVKDSIKYRGDWGSFNRDDEKPTVWFNIQKPGVVATYELFGYEMRMDQELWDTCMGHKAKLDKREREHPKIRKDSFEKIVKILAQNIGVAFPDSFKIDQFLIWILAHDSLFGVRATNKEIKWVAKTWSKNPKSYHNRYLPIVGKPALVKLQERLQKCVKFKIEA